MGARVANSAAFEKCAVGEFAKRLFKNGRLNTDFHG
jgi:hypothetical protein